MTEYHLLDLSGGQLIRDAPQAGWHVDFDAVLSWLAERGVETTTFNANHRNVHFALDGDLALELRMRWE